MLEKKGIEKYRFSGPKGSTDRGYGQPAQPIKEPINQLPSSRQGPVKDAPKTFSLSLPVAFSSQSRSDRGLVEATVTCHSLNVLTANEPVDP